MFFSIRHLLLLYLVVLVEILLFSEFWWGALALDKWHTSGRGYKFKKFYALMQRERIQSVDIRNDFLDIERKIRVRNVHITNLNFVPDPKSRKVFRLDHDYFFQEIYYVWFFKTCRVSFTMLCFLYWSFQIAPHCNALCIYFCPIQVRKVHQEHSFDYMTF